MRFKRIKLAGFKSFVDPVTVEFPSALVGIAGPNGSGKSNIVDAVRWVMGESSARHLRGGQMADVIFNGSAGRQPAGVASVEMVFDNNEGRLGGEYATWSEIAIRRSVDREGISSYYLNGTRCRRRDITDVFLGTGLGPRSYALIEQGTISRLVESKPEELREFIEEAAGVSRYKERRRETETRIRHTRENLDRVDDVLEEVSKHLAHLRRQARAAERYRELKGEERRLRAELLALRVRSLDAELDVREREAREQGVAVEAEAARERATERDLAAARARHDAALAAANEVQQRYFELQTEIARLEEAIAGARRERQLRHERLQALVEQLAENERRAAADARRADELLGEVERLEPEFAAAQARALEARAAREAADAAAAARHQQDARHREAFAEARRRLAVAETQIGAAAEREDALRLRARRLTEERDRLEEQTAGSLDAGARGEVTRLRREARATEVVAEGAERRVQQARHQLRAASENLAERRRKLASMEGRLESFDAIIRAECGGEAAERWLSEHDLASAQRLAAVLEIRGGWEWAVEVVLGSRLAAVKTGPLDEKLIGGLTRSDGVELTLVEGGKQPPAAAGTLAAQIAAPAPAISEFLEGVRTAESVAGAFAARGALQAGETLVTRDGVWVGRYWVRIARPPEGGNGRLGREHERQRTAEQVAELARETAVAERESGRAEQALHEAESHYAETRGTARGAQEALAAGLAAEAEAAGRERGAVERLEALRGELDEIDAALAQLDSERGHLAESAKQAEHAVTAMGSERHAHESALEKDQTAAVRARERAEAAAEARQALALKLESLRAQANAAAEAATRLNAERARLASERERLESLLGETGDPSAELQMELEANLTGHRKLEEELSAARDRAAEIEMQVTELERGRRAVSSQVAELREELGSVRLAVQDLKTRREGVAEQLAELGAEPQAVLDATPPEAKAAEWEQRLEATVQRIQRLGPINLAAIDECAAESQREDYLKRQRDDLAEAMATLEEAIRRIDRETRARFKETFDRVNERLAELFPRLFGGGKAVLALTSEELLEAGVVVTARPPGKKNTTIQMLSGGEKALTAVALVFAIFELNPAPFCMLDEVDAPMDDANVERFCSLVRELSKRTQFVLITHNRRTMALCHQLVGVTMQEPGVSRLVGVDIDEAARLAVG